MQKSFRQRVIRWIGRLTGNTFLRTDHQVGIIFESLSDVIENPEKHVKCIKWLNKPTKNANFLSPFIVKMNMRHHLFLTLDNTKLGKQKIYSTEENIGFDYYYLALASDHHHSFPAMVQHENQLFCVPQTNESGRVALYRFDADSRKLVPEAVLLEGTDAIAPLLYCHENHWYLFFTQVHQNIPKLCIFQSSELTGPYLPHPCHLKHPSGRSAGQFFTHQGKLMRPVLQFENETTIVQINEVTTINQLDFNEILLKSIGPVDHKYFANGLFMLGGTDEYTVVEGRRTVFTFAGTKLFARRKTGFIPTT